MKLKRAALTGILLWVLIFFEVSILMFGFKLEGTGYYVAHYVLLIALVTISAFIYFKNKEIKPGLKEGFILGVIYVIVGIILDLIITIPLFVKDYVAFYNIWLLIGLVETIVVASIIGLIKK